MAGLGVLAGLAGAVAMTGVIRSLGRFVGGGQAAQFNAAADAQRWAETLPSGGGHLPPSQEAVSQLAEEPSSSPKALVAWGTVAHLALGAGLGAVYAVARPRGLGALPAGLLFGTGVWLIADELMVPLLGLGKGPHKQGIAEHGLAFVAHLAYGAVTAGTLALVAADHRAEALDVFDARDVVEEDVGARRFGRQPV